MILKCHLCLVTLKITVYLIIKLFQSLSSRLACCMRSVLVEQTVVRCSCITPLLFFPRTVEAQNETDGSGSSSRDALVESLTHIQQKHMVEVDDPPAEMTVVDQEPTNSRKLWKAVVAVTSRLGAVF